MKRHLIGFILAVLMGVCLSTSAEQAAAAPKAKTAKLAVENNGKLYGATQITPDVKTATLTVDLDKPGVKVAPTLYGIFFEEINRAGDGGLYAEMLQNRSFEDAASRDAKPADPLAWTLVVDGKAEGKMSLDTSKPLNPQNLHSLKLEITKAEGGQVGIANDGFHGMKKESPKGLYFKEGAQYAFSLYARSENFAGPLTVSLLDKPDGKAVASASISGIGGEWKKFECSLQPTSTTTVGRLVVSAGAVGTVYLDMVSLFPKETWKGHGMRPDLAEMLMGMKPAFVRFPGGCWVEGDTMATAYRWKETIGDVSVRRNLWNLWRYFSTNGLGFHEYLQLCEDLGAAPLFVVNCGMSHKEQHEQTPAAKDPRMAEYVQDALDAIEYANGPADSKWGAERAKAGHPAPFNLKYMEIGNENGGKAYHERYALFYDAIKAKYPYMNLVADVWGGTPTNRPVEMIDEHYYSTPEFFIGQADRYDRYDRTGPKIYIGEYAVTRGSGVGNLRGAIGEAAFMTGMERNSDVVVMGSYAPLYAQVYYKGWNPDLIYFDAARVYGTPSYYVQAMFGNNRCDEVSPMEVKCPPVQPDTTTSRKGAVGVGAWLTQAEFKDIKVTQGDKVLMENFADAKAWNTHGGKWEMKDGVYSQSAVTEEVYATAGDANWSDYTLTLKARKTGGHEGFLILFHVKGDKNLTWWNVGGWGNSKHALEVTANGHKQEMGTEAGGKIETGRWYDVRVEVKGNAVKCFLDDKLVHEASYGVSDASVFAVAGRQGEDVVLKVVNASAKPMDAEINLRGIKGVSGGTISVLTNDDPMAENSLEKPANVAPATKPIEKAATTFTQSLPGNSVTVIRLKMAK